MNMILRYLKGPVFNKPVNFVVANTIPIPYTPPDAELFQRIKIVNISAEQENAPLWVKQARVENSVAEFWEVMVDDADKDTDVKRAAAVVHPDEKKMDG